MYRQMQYYVAVVERGSFSEAAFACHISQSAISQQIRALEEELNVTLLNRQGRRFEMTPAGRWFYQRAKRQVAEMDSIVREVRREHPGIRIHLSSGNAQEVTECLDKGLLDFGVLIQPASLVKYEHLPLPERDVWVAVVPAGHPLAELPCATRQELLPWPLILSQQAIVDTGPDNEFIGWFGKDFARVNVAATFNLVYNATLLVRSGIGVLVSIDGLVGASGQSGLASIPLEPSLETALDIVWRRGRIFSPAAALVLAAFQERFGNPR